MFDPEVRKAEILRLSGGTTKEGEEQAPPLPPAMDVGSLVSNAASNEGESSRAGCQHAGEAPETAHSVAVTSTAGRSDEVGRHAGVVGEDEAGKKKADHKHNQHGKRPESADPEARPPAKADARNDSNTMHLDPEAHKAAILDLSSNRTAISGELEEQAPPPSADAFDSLPFNTLCDEESPNVRTPNRGEEAEPVQKAPEGADSRIMLLWDDSSEDTTDVEAGAAEQQGFFDQRCESNWPSSVVPTIPAARLQSQEPVGDGALQDDVVAAVAVYDDGTDSEEVRQLQNTVQKLQQQLLVQNDVVRELRESLDSLSSSSSYTEYPTMIGSSQSDDLVAMSGDKSPPAAAAGGPNPSMMKRMYTILATGFCLLLVVLLATVIPLAVLTTQKNSGAPEPASSAGVTGTPSPNSRVAETDPLTAVVPETRVPGPELTPVAERTTWYPETEPPTLNRIFRPPPSVTTGVPATEQPTFRVPSTEAPIIPETPPPAPEPQIPDGAQGGARGDAQGGAPGDASGGGDAYGGWGGDARGNGDGGESGDGGGAPGDASGGGDAWGGWGGDGGGSGDGGEGGNGGKKDSGHGFYTPQTPRPTASSSIGTQIPTSETTEAPSDSEDTNPQTPRPTASSSVGTQMPTSDPPTGSTIPPGELTKPVSSVPPTGSADREPSSPAGESSLIGNRLSAGAIAGISVVSVAAVLGAACLLLLYFRAARHQISTTADSKETFAAACSPPKPKTKPSGTTGGRLLAAIGEDEELTLPTPPLSPSVSELREHIRALKSRVNDRADTARQLAALLEERRLETQQR